MLVKYLFVSFLPLLLIINSLSLATVKRKEKISVEYVKEFSVFLRDIVETLFVENISFFIVNLQNDGRAMSFLLHMFGSNNTPFIAVDTRKQSYRDSKETIKQISDNDLVVFFINTWIDIVQLLIYTDPNNRACYLVIWDPLSVNVNKDDINEIVSFMSSKQYYRFALLYTEDSYGRNNMAYKGYIHAIPLTIMTFNAFERSNYTETANIQNVHKLKKVFIEAFSIHKISHLRSYPIRVSTMQDTSPPFFDVTEIDGTYAYSGYLPKVFDMLIMYMNFTMVITRRHGRNKYGYKLPNGSWDGVIGDLSRKEVDMSYTSLAINQEIYQVAEFSETYGIDQLSIMVAKSKIVPPWKVLITIYQTPVLLATVFLFVLVVIASLLTQKVKEQKLNFCSEILRLLGIFCQISVTQPKGILMRILFFLWVYFSLVIGSIFTGSIISALTNPKYFPDIMTLRELYDSGITLRGTRFFKSLFNEKSNPFLWGLHETYQIDSDFEDVIVTIIHNEKIGVMTTKAVLKYYTNKVKTCSSCRESFHILSESFGNLIRAIAFPKGSLYVYRVNVLISRMRETGLLSKWCTEEIIRSQNSHSCVNGCNNDNKVLSLEDLELSFYILFTGISLGLSAFVCELFYLKQCQYSKHCKCLLKKVKETI